MVRRLIIKTMMICTGILTVLFSTAMLFIFKDREFDDEKRFRVLVAARPIEEGTVLTQSHISYRIIKESALNSYMITDIDEAIGKKCMHKVEEGDYLRNYQLLPKEKWYEDGDKKIVLPMDIESRMANLIRKGSLIDIKVDISGSKSPPKVVLAKIPVEDILDETGTSINDSLSSKRAFAVVILNKEQRDRLYMAKKAGNLVYELYCDPTQKPAKEEFFIYHEEENLSLKQDTISHKPDDRIIESEVNKDQNE